MLILNIIDDPNQRNTLEKNHYKAQYDKVLIGQETCLTNRFRITLDEASLSLLAAQLCLMPLIQPTTNHQYLQTGVVLQITWSVHLWQEYCGCGVNTDVKQTQNSSLLHLIFGRFIFQQECKKHILSAHWRGNKVTNLILPTISTCHRVNFGLWAGGFYI